MPGGRPSKLTPEVQEAICSALSDGNTRKDSAAVAGTTYKSFGVWMRKGRAEPDGEYGAFRAAVKKAEAEAVTRNVGIIKTAAETTWTAAAWWLERRRPADFGKRERHEHTGPGGAEIVVKVIGRGTSVDEL